MNKAKLGNFIDVIRGKSLPGINYSEQGTLIRLTLGNFYEQGGFKYNTSKKDIYYIGKVSPEYILKKGDIITPLTEQSRGLLGATARIPESGKYIHSQDIGLVKCKSGKMHPSFCYYLLSSLMVRKQLSAGAQQTKIRHTSPDKIKDVAVIVPEYDTQLKIGELLDTITNKIELNSRINLNLKKLAKALYDYWFVQFDFPNENKRPYKSSGGKMVYNEVLKREIPIGWEVKPLGDICDLYQSETISEKDCIEDGKYYVYGSNGIIGKYNEKNHNESEIVISCRGNCGNVIRTMPNVWITGNAMVIHPKEEIGKEFIYFMLKNAGIKRIITGSVQGQITRRNLAPVEIMLPPKHLLEMYEKQIRSNVKTRIQNCQESDCLINLRNFLLPMLMNGQITINS